MSDVGKPEALFAPVMEMIRALREKGLNPSQFGFSRGKRSLMRVGGCPSLDFGPLPDKKVSLLPCQAVFVGRPSGALLKKSMPKFRMGVNNINMAKGMNPGSLGRKEAARNSGPAVRMACLRGSGPPAFRSGLRWADDFISKPFAHGNEPDRSPLHPLSPDLALLEGDLMNLNSEWRLGRE
jgi:hypothetical protein